MPPSPLTNAGLHSNKALGRAKTPHMCNVVTVARRWAGESREGDLADNNNRSVLPRAFVGRMMVLGYP